MFEPAGQVNKKLKIVVYGEPGVGKTWFGLQAPGNIALFDTENGSDFYGNKFKFDVKKTRKYSELIKAIDYIEAHPDKYDVLIIDPITNVYQTLKDAAQITAENRALRKKKPTDDVALTQRDWGSIKQRYTSLISRLCNLPCHVVITGWVKDIYEGEGDKRRKVGTAIDADKKTGYQPDVIIDLQVDGRGNRFGVVEKDRTMSFQKGARVPDISFNHFIDAVSNEGSLSILDVDDQVAVSESAGFDPIQSETIDKVKLAWLNKELKPAALNVQIDKVYGISSIEQLSEVQGRELLKKINAMEAKND